MRFNPDYDPKQVFKTLCILIAITILQKFTGGAGFAVLAPFIVLATLRRNAESLIFWVIICIFCMIGNTFFLPRCGTFFIAQRGALILLGAVMMAQLAGSRTHRLVKPFYGLLLYLAFMILPSINGWAPLISMLKMFLFTMVFFAFMGVANSELNSPRLNVVRLRSIMLAFFAYYIFGSVLVWPFPAVGQLSGAEYELMIKSGQEVVSLFKGMTEHSQALGPTMAFFFTFLFADLVFNIRRWDKLYVALMLCCPPLIYVSSSRAGMAVMIMGVVIVGYCLMRSRGMGRRWKSKVVSMLTLSLSVIMLAILASPSAQNAVVRYALKYGTEGKKASDFSTEEMMSTRQFLIDAEMENFRKSPVIGNGFQVSLQVAEMQRNSWKDYLTAPVEKGVWIPAVLEEGGVIGLTILCIWILITGFALLKRGGHVGLAIFFVTIISNMAEFTMFAMSATGGLLWALVFIGLIFDGARQRQFGVT